MPSVSNLLIMVDLQSGVIIGAGNTAADAETGAFNTNGPISRSQRPLIDEIFCKVLAAIYGGKRTIDLKTENGTTIVRDDSFPLPSIDQHVALAFETGGANTPATAVELIRSIVDQVPATTKSTRTRKHRAPRKNKSKK